MWAAVLVPMWLRRHDNAMESRSMDRFSAAMRILSRRGTGAGRAVVMPRRASAGPTWHVSGASDPDARRRPRPSRQLVARRRRTFLGLVGAVLLTLVLAVAGALPWVVQVVADLLLVAFVGHLRRQALARRGRPARAPRERAVPTAEPWPEPAVPVEPARAWSPSAPAWADAPMQPADVPAPQPAASEQTGTDGWAPTPVPPPTYTLKPTVPGAMSASRMVDLTRPGRYADAVEAEQRLMSREEPAVDELVEEVEDDELDAIVERRRAVND